MTRTLKTQNSTYEIDEDAKRIRRLQGVNEPTQYFGEDGVWQEYDELVSLWHGGVVVHWPHGGSTITSSAQPE